MRTIDGISKSAFEQLKKLDPKCWTKAYFGTTCQADNVENNMSECFNAWIINERYLIAFFLLIFVEILTSKTACFLSKKVLAIAKYAPRNSFQNNE